MVGELQFFKVNSYYSNDEIFVASGWWWKTQIIIINLLNGGKSCSIIQSHLERMAIVISF